MPGRRPKPTRLKLLEGTTRADRARENEPEPPEGEIVRPDYVKYRAAEIWDANIAIVTAMGTLTVADVQPFARWCVGMAEFEEKKWDMKATDKAELRHLESILGIGAPSRTKLGRVKDKSDPSRKYFSARKNAG